MEKITQVSTSQLAPSTLNPRKHIDQKSISELAQSIREQGILSPLLVRPDADGFEIICGERRFQAALLAELETIPCIVKKMEDDQALEIMLIENLQREGVHPMEEAQSIQSLKASGLTIDQLSTKLGKSTAYIQKRMRLLSLIPAAQKKFILGEMEYAQAIQIARLEPTDQEKVLKEATTGYGASQRLKDSKGLAEYIESSIMLRFKDAIFKLDDDTLYPEAGSCDTCPKRTRNATSLFDEADTSDRCVDGACFRKKGQLFIKRQQEEAKKKHGEVVTGSMSYGRNTVKVKGQDLTILKKKEEGAVAVVITSDSGINSKKGKVVFAMKPEEVKAAKGKSAPISAKAKEEKDKKEIVFKKAFKMAIFKKLFPLIWSEKRTTEFEPLIMEFIMEGDLPDFFSVQEALAVEMGYATIKDGQDYSDCNLKKNEIENIKKQLSTYSLTAIILLLIAANDAEISWGNPKLSKDCDLGRVCTIHGIDWDKELKEFTENAKKVADSAIKVAPDTKKVAPPAKPAAKKTPAKKTAVKKGKGLAALLTDA